MPAARESSRSLRSATVKQPRATRPPAKRPCDSTSSWPIVACTCRDRACTCSAACACCSTSSALCTVRWTAPAMRVPLRPSQISILMEGLVPGSRSTSRSSWSICTRDRCSRTMRSGRSFAIRKTAAAAIARKVAPGSGSKSPSRAQATWWPVRQSAIGPWHAAARRRSDAPQGSTVSASVLCGKGASSPFLMTSCISGRMRIRERTLVSPRR